MVAAIRLARSPRGARAPSLAAALAGIIGAGEEVSWGQLILDIAPPSFFSTHNVQGEINVHNLIHPPWDALLGAAVILGFCLSPLWRRATWVRRLARRGLPWPRPLHAGVLAACLGGGLLVAVTTGVGEMEELGELVFVLVVAATWCGHQD